MSLKEVPWEFCDDFKRPLQNVEGDLRNTLNVVGTSVMRAGGFYGGLIKYPLWPSMKTRLNHKIDSKLVL